ncbi:MAG: rhodanese-related sulfurtransferase [Bacteroidia bacterium]
MALYNKVNREELKKRLQEESIKRITLSFYRYVIIEDPQLLRDTLFRQWQELNIMGRIYVAREGINAQMSVPEANWEQFMTLLYADNRFKDVPLKIAVEDDGKSFYRLTIKVRPKIVADGLDDNAFDVTNVGTHLSAKAFNEAMELPGTMVVDMRNHYESEIGHFENAITPYADTFREELPIVAEMLKDKKDQKLLLYCTGGIRCEKASAYFKHQGFTDVNQLHGGIIDYARQIKAQGLPSKFKGKNFVFDERLGEQISNDVISTCHQCGTASDTHTNCANEACHLLFIQCDSCRDKFQGCCTPACVDTLALPEEERRMKRKQAAKDDSLSVYKSRLRPDLREILKKK